MQFTKTKIMKVNLNKSLLTLEGVELQDANIGKIVANAFSQITQGDALKIMSWAKKLHNGEELDLDPSDAITFKDLINNNHQMTLLLKEQILESLV